MKRAVLAAVSLILISSCRKEQTAQSAMEFAESVYKNYRTDSDFSPFEHQEKLFGKELREWIRKDAEAAGGQVGYLDGDPLTDSQDNDGMTISSITIDSSGGNFYADITVLFPLDTNRIRLKLGQEEGSWKVLDISSTSFESLVESIKSYIKTEYKDSI